jgi:hypothetical protein
MFYLLDNVLEGDRDGKIYKIQFLKIFEVYEIWKYEYRQTRFFQIQNDPQQMKKKPWLYHMREGMTSILYEYLLNVASILMFAEIIFRERFYGFNYEQLDIWFKI